MDMSDTEASKDLLGRTYEYCIAQFASYEGVKGGEFYTPASVVKTIVSILKPSEGKRVYDPCCGSGGMFVQSVKFIQEHAGNRNNISVFGQEANADTFTAFQNGTLEDVKGFCATVKTEDIAKQDYILTPGRYVGIEEKAEDDEPFDEKMKRLTTELGGMFAKSHELEEEIKKNLAGIGWKI